MAPFGASRCSSPIASSAPGAPWCSARARSVSRSDPQPITRERRRLDLRDIDVRAPTRLVRRSAARFKVRPEGIGYLIASPDFTSPRAHHWVAYFKNGVYVQGDATGKVERRIQ